MTATGMGVGELGDELGRAGSRERVDPLVRQRRDLRRELFDAARDEGAVDEVAQPRVLGRLELQDRMPLERVERLKMRLAARASPAPRGSSHAGSAGRSGGRAAAPETSAWRAKHQKP